MAATIILKPGYGFAFKNALLGLRSLNSDPARSEWRVSERSLRIICRDSEGSILGTLTLSSAYCDIWRVETCFTIFGVSLSDQMEDVEMTLVPPRDPQHELTIEIRPVHNANGEEEVVKRNGPDDTTFVFFFPEAQHYNTIDPIEDPDLSLLNLDGSTLSTYLQLMKILPEDSILGDGYNMRLTVKRNDPISCVFSCYNKGKLLQCEIPVNPEDLHLVGGGEQGSIEGRVESIDEAGSWNVEKFVTVLTIPLYMGVLSRNMMSTKVVIPFRHDLPAYVEYVISVIREVSPGEEEEKCSK